MWHIAARQYTAENGMVNALYIGLLLLTASKIKGLVDFKETKSLIIEAFDTALRHMTH
jgi:hypothetical protein